MKIIKSYRLWLGVLLLCIVASSIYYFLPPRPLAHADIPIVDIEVGEQVADMISRSSYDFSFLRKISPIYSTILLSAYETERDGRHFVRLRNGDKSLLFPWYPLRGTIHMDAGVLSEIELSFWNYNLATPQSGLDAKGIDEVLSGTREQEVQAILDGYFLLKELKMTPVDPPHCYTNSYPTTPQTCNDRRVLDVKNWTRAELKAELVSYMNDVDYAFTKNIGSAVDKVKTLTFGQWITTSGALVRLYIRHQSDGGHFGSIPIKERQPYFALNLKVHNNFRASKATYMRACYHSKARWAVPAWRVTYTPAQAKFIYGSLMEVMGPLKYQGKSVTEWPEVLHHMSDSKGHESNDSWGMPSNSGLDPDYCSLIPDLEKQVGYDAARDDLPYGR